MYKIKENKQQEILKLPLIHKQNIQQENIYNSKINKSSNYSMMISPQITKKKKKIQQSNEKPIETKTEKPSDRLSKIKTIDPFVNKEKLSSNSFAFVYEAGGIPCKINHNGVGTMKVIWNPGIDIQTLPYDPVLVTCFDGLLEEGYPYCAIAKTAINEMISYIGATEKIIDILPKLIKPLRNALISKSDKVFDSALDILILLSNIVGSHLNKYLKQFIVPLSKRMRKFEFSNKIYIALRTLEENGGPDVYEKIKAAIPTYSNI